MFKKIFGQIYIWLILILMYLPIALITAYSFSDGIIGGEYIFTFDLYVNLFTTKPDIMIALGNTVLIALISASISTLLGTVGAIGAFYSKRRGKQAVELMTQIPVVNAEIVVAFSLTVLFVFIGNKIFDGKEIFGFWTLLIGHCCLSVPFVYLSVKPKLQQMDPSLYEAAMDLGCNPRQALFKATLPAIMPGVLSGFMLSITLSLDDFIVTSFTRGAGLLSGDSNIETISTYIQDHMKRKNIPNETRALTALVFLTVILVVIGISIYRYQKSKQIKVRKGRAAV